TGVPTKQREQAAMVYQTALLNRNEYQFENRFYRYKEMHKIKLPSVTLLGVDCVNIDRLVMVSKLCQRHIEFGAVKLLSSLSSNCKIITQIPDIPSHEEYSKFVIKDLNKYVQTSHVLIMQHDGFVLNYRAWDERFLDYDYIGAPWCYTDGLSVGN